MDKNAELSAKPYVMEVRTLHLFVPWQFYNQSLQLAKDLIVAEHSENKGYITDETTSEDADVSHEEDLGE